MASSSDDIKLRNGFTSDTPLVDGSKPIPNGTKQPDPLPAYTPPTTGILSVLPPSWIPYGELMRLEKPAGLYAFFVPFLLGTFHAANLSTPVPTPSHLAHLTTLFLAFSILSRGAACTWNDALDAPFDRLVPRCRLRPLARRAIPLRSAHLFAATQTALSIAVLAALPGNCVPHAAVLTSLWFLYPFAKRVTHYPQVVLGFPFAWAVPVACSALGVEAFSPTNRVATTALFAANVLWTIIYDTIYAHQDAAADVAAGVKSMAVRFGPRTKLLASALSVLQFGLLVIVGVQAGFGPLYFAGSCVGAALGMARMLVKVNLGDPASCAWFFRHGFFEVGGCMVGGLVAQYLVRLGGVY